MKATGEQAHLPSLEGVRVLVVEDGLDNQRLIEFHLRKAGATVEIADNGKLAVQRLTVDGKIDGAWKNDGKIDLILMDMQMPEMDGYDATRMLRGKGCKLPIIALTAHAMDTDYEKSSSAGCDLHLTKPIDKDMLIQACRKMLNG